MKNPNKYNTPEDTPGMVSESLGVATTRSNMIQAYPLYTDDVDSPDEVMEIEPLQYSLEELSARLEESENQFLTGNFLTMEEADRDMELFISALR